jgi:hypothetical protein
MARKTELEQLQTLGTEGLAVRYPRGPQPTAIKQINAELAVLDHAGLAKWLLAAADVGQFAQAKRIFCRLVGRNPSPMLTYLLGLSAVDPLRYPLPMGLPSEPEQEGISELRFAVDPWYAKPLADFVHKRCEPDMVEEEIRLPRLYVETLAPYHVLDIACRKPGVADGRLQFQSACQWELLPALVAMMIESVTAPLFDLAGIPLDNGRVFDAIRRGCDLEVYPPDWDEWNEWTVHVPNATSIEDIAQDEMKLRFQSKQAERQGLSYSAIASAINTYQVVYLKTHYPLEFEAAIQQRWPSLPVEDEF